MALHTQLLQSCVEEAASAGGAALGRAMDDALTALQIAQTQSMKSADHDLLAAACLGLIKHKPSWTTQYPADLLAAFLHGVPSTGGRLQPDGSAPAALGRAGTPRHASFAGSSSPGGLSLLDDADVSQSIEASKLLQQVLPTVDLPLAELDRLISAAQGLANVRPELNPLRPEVFTVTLRTLVYANGPDAAMALLWLRYLAAPLGRELKLIYEKAASRLELGQVRGVSYRVVQTPAGATRHGGIRRSDQGIESVRGELRGQAGEALVPSGRSSGQSRPAGLTSAEGSVAQGDQFADEPDWPSHYTDLSDQGIKKALLSDFLQGDAQAEARHGLAPAYYDDIEEEIRALKREREPPPEPVAPAPTEQTAADEEPDNYAELPPVDRPQPVINELSQLSEKIWGVFGRRKARAQVRAELKKDATRVGQVLGLEAVRQLVNQVAQDASLLAPVREAIVALEPSLLRLAMVDPRFFADEAHPGRRLMERTAQRSFNYNDELRVEFSAFFEPVAEAFNQLNTLEIEDAQPFAQALALLEQGWAQQDQLDASQRQAALQALRFAEERQALADSLAFDLSRRSDLSDVPGLVLDFLFGPWALVMAHARLSDTRNQIDPQGFGSLVSDLIWSTKRAMTLKQPAKLIAMIPKLLAQLQAGLALLGTDAAQTQGFFDGLMRLHQPVLNLRRTKTLKDAEESTHATLASANFPEDLLEDEDRATPEQRLAKAAAQPWLARRDLEAAGFEELSASDLSALQQADAPPSSHVGDDASNRSFADAAPPANDSANDSADDPAYNPAHDDSPAPTTSHAMSGKAPAEPATATIDAPAVPTAGSNVAAPRASLTPADVESALHALHTGLWVDLYARKRWRRAQLIWTSSKGTLFMFVSHGGQAHSMTRRSCERLLMARLLRPVAMHGVVAQALDAVSQEAAAQLIKQLSAAPPRTGPPA